MAWPLPSADAWRGFVGHAAKFGVVGAVGYVIDVVIFNVLRFGGVAEGTWAAAPVGAKILSVTVATVVTWFGNRWWTFRAQRRSNHWLELAEFSLVAAAGMGIAVSCLAISHYVLGFTSPLADNIAANVVGLALATTFRFLMYRHWVFGAQRRDSMLRASDDGA